MNDGRRRLLNALEALGRRYVREFLADEWPQAELKADWFKAFTFLLWRLYAQGRADSLSVRYARAMVACLTEFFTRDPEARLGRLWQKRHIPHDPDWTKFHEEASDLWQRFDKTMGKPRDREMVLDALRYVYPLEGHNVIAHSLAAMDAGRLREHRQELMNLWGVGPKTSAFYLRDVTFCFRCELAPEDSVHIQPIDTWVRQVVRALAGADVIAEDWLVKQGHDGYDPALLNAGAWYLGKHSFQLVLSLLADDSLAPEALERLALGTAADG